MSSSIAPTAVRFTRKADGNIEGMPATLNVTATIALVSVTRKAKDSVCE